MDEKTTNGRDKSRRDDQEQVKPEIKQIGFFEETFGTSSRNASVFELSVISTVSILVFFVQYLRAAKTGGLDFAEILASSFERPSVAVLTTLLFYEFFSFFLTGRSILVILSDVFARRGAAIGVRSAQKRSAEPVDSAIFLFQTHVRRSHEAFSTAQGRPNALLFVGTTIAIVGLVFFILTLPGFVLSFTPGALSTGDLAQRFLELTPRLLMLVFIQLLAGFFLRQYRSAMEEVRYYEAILRHRESQFMSYLIRRSSGGSLDDFSNHLLEQRDFLKVKAGESTLVLEANKSEVNEFQGIIDAISSLGRSVPRGSSPKRKSRPAQSTEA